MRILLLLLLLLLLCCCCTWLLTACYCCCCYFIMLYNSIRTNRQVTVFERTSCLSVLLLYYHVPVGTVTTAPSAKAQAQEGKRQRRQMRATPDGNIRNVLSRLTSWSTLCNTFFLLDSHFFCRMANSKNCCWFVESDSSVFSLH